MNSGRKTVIIFSLIMSIIVIILTVLLLRVFVIRTVIIDEYSPDNEYHVVISENGQSKWPFGESNCQIILKNGNRTISDIVLKIDTDGGAADREFFKIEWEEQYAKVAVELVLNLPDQEYLLYYSGEVEQRDYTIDSLQGTFKNTFNTSYLEFDNETVKKKTLSDEQTGYFEVHGFKYIWLIFQGPAVVYRYDENTNTLTNVHIETDVLYKSDMNE